MKVLVQQILACAVMIGLASPVWAEDIALVVSNLGSRDSAAGAELREASDTLRQEGIAVISGRDMALRDLQNALSQFEQMAGQADGLLVVLAGRFVQGGNDTYFLPVDSDVPGLTALPGQALSLSLMLQLLAAAPGEAFLALAEQRFDGVQGPFLQDGIGDLAIPQGVTVLRGAPGAVAKVVRAQLAVPGGAVGLSDGVDVDGFLPEGHGFLGRDVTSGAALDRARDRASAAERRAEAAMQMVQTLRRQLAQFDDAAWNAAARDNTVQAYRRYVDLFPDGLHTDQALRLIREIEDEPFREARLAEEALSLSREQRRAVQSDLTGLGYNTRGIDGIFGPGTRSAIQDWQGNSGRAPSGFLNRVELRLLSDEADTAEARRQAEEDARRAEAAREDLLFWQRNGSGASEAGLRAYLNRYPQGRFATEAQQRLNRIDQERRVAEDERRRSARREEELAFWQITGALGTLAGLRAYLDRFPDGVYGDQARDIIGSHSDRRAERDRDIEGQRRQDLSYWRETGASGTRAGLRAYLDRYPEGLRSEQARDTLARLSERETGRDNQSDRQSWAAAERENTIAAYRRYIQRVPNGAFIGEAEARIAALRGQGGNSAQQEEQSLGLNRIRRLSVENHLAEAGFDPGQRDGAFDRATRRALRQYQNANGMEATGYVDQALLLKLTLSPGSN